MGERISLRVYPFTGKEDDLAVGLTYFGRRYLIPALGRWASPDPLAVHSPGSADLNLYAYVKGQLLRATDPVGLDLEKDGAPGPSPGYSYGPSDFAKDTIGGTAPTAPAPAGAGGVGAAPPPVPEGKGGDPAFAEEGRVMPQGAAASTGSSGGVSTPSTETRAGPTHVGALFMAVPTAPSRWIGTALEGLDFRIWGRPAGPGEPEMAIAGVGGKRGPMPMPLRVTRQQPSPAATAPSPPAGMPSPVATAPYVRPSHATTPAQRASVQGKPCVDCGKIDAVQRADHKLPLVKEHWQTGTIDLARMRSLNAVQPQCATCSNQQGRELQKYSMEQLKLFSGQF